jgi:hypothetical protein
MSQTSDNCFTEAAGRYASIKEAEFVVSTRWSTGTQLGGYAPEIKRDITL